MTWVICTLLALSWIRVVMTAECRPGEYWDNAVDRCESCRKECPYKNQGGLPAQCVAICKKESTTVTANSEPSGTPETSIVMIAIIILMILVIVVATVAIPTVLCRKKQCRKKPLKFSQQETGEAPADHSLHRLTTSVV